MPTNTNILLIRHAEKPANGSLLAVPGQERAAAYTIYFQNFATNGGRPLKLNYLFATADSNASQRPRLTLEPLAQALDLKLNSKHSNSDYLKVADVILQKPKYDNSDILICWHHGKILKLAEALGVDPGKLPPSANWPSPEWPDDVFGWVLQICYGADGKIDTAQTLCLNQRLMYDDYGNEPPGGKSPAASNP